MGRHKEKKKKACEDAKCNLFQEIRSKEVFEQEKIYVVCKA